MIVWKGYFEKFEQTDLVEFELNGKKCRDKEEIKVGNSPISNFR